MRRIAATLGCSPTTVRRYVAAGGWVAYRVPERPGALDGVSTWIAERDPHFHGTTGKAPLARFLRDEALAQRPLECRPPFRQVRELSRAVQSDRCIELDTNVSAR